ncbi:hypothetical protein AMTRI_Chr07g81750 [Amborella trichopoda]
MENKQFAVRDDEENSHKENKNRSGKPINGGKHLERENLQVSEKSNDLTDNFQVCPLIILGRNCPSSEDEFKDGVSLGRSSVVIEHETRRDEENLQDRKKSKISTDNLQVSPVTSPSLNVPSAECKWRSLERSSVVINQEMGRDGENDRTHKLDSSENSKTLEKDGETQENTGSSGKRRRSTWELESKEGEKDLVEGEGAGKRRKSGWAEDDTKIKMMGPIKLPDFVEELAVGLENDPEVQALNAQLLEINRKLRSGVVLYENKPYEPRSPSPEPIYDNLGIRINTRDCRAREKLTKERQEVISRLVQKNPSFNPPVDYKPSKLYNKLYIPVKEYPDFNFIGFLLGPRGNTLKRMERETGARIVIRGKGSVKEGRALQKHHVKLESLHDEDLHILVEADNQQSLDAAVSILEKLLNPMNGGRNKHKHEQLKELSLINGATRGKDFVRLYKEKGHKEYACPNRNSNFKANVFCLLCRDSGHLTVGCPLKCSNLGTQIDKEYHSCLLENGGGLGWPINVTRAHKAPRFALGSTLTFDHKPKKEIDISKLYVSYLHPFMNSEHLIELFAPFGQIEDAIVIKDRVTGASKGYGFVKFVHAVSAFQAITCMNGFRIGGKTLAVRVAGWPPHTSVVGPM